MDEEAKILRSMNVAVTTNMHLVKKVILNMKRTAFRVLVLIGLCLPGTGQLKAQHDTQYISKLHHTNFLQLYAGGFSRSIDFFSGSKRNSAHQVTFSPNSSAFCGFIFGYKNITLYGDVAIPQTSKVNREQTDVRAFSIFLSHFKYKWGITGFTSYNRGLLMAAENTVMMYNNRSDLRKFTVGAHMYRIFNASKFSFIAANSQQMLQQKSAGSFIIKLTPSYRILQSPESIIPVEKSKYHLTGEMTMSRRLQLFSMQLKPGYAHNFVLNKTHFFIAPSLFAGPGADYHLLQQTNSRHHGFNVNFGYRFKITAGINKQKYFATIEALTDHTRSYLYQTVAKNTYKECTVNIGWRF
jgi:hypothetical protein